MKMTTPIRVGLAAAALVAGAFLLSHGVSAEEATPPTPPAPITFNKGDNAWMLTSTVLVLLMTIPGLALFYGGLVRSKNMLSVFTQVFVISGGGPVNATLMYVLYLYMNGWQFFKMGYAAALAWVLFALILVLTLLTLKLSGRLVFYEFAESE